MESEFAHLMTIDGLIGLITLIVMEIVLGIDNIIFISILAGKLPKNLQGLFCHINKITRLIK